MPISINMLCMRAQAYKITDYDEDRNPIYADDPDDLDRVYITYNDGQSDGAQGKTPASRAALYYDVLNSLPKGYTFTKGDKIEVDGEKFTIENIKPFYNKNGLQHIEADLI